ncbi:MULTISPECIES: alpha/beta fold hydrolase [unclassified Bradyrhizobium]
MNHISHRVPFDGGFLHALSSGQGDETIVLLHGWPQTSRQWERVSALLDGDYQLIAPDLRGCGDSSKPLTGYDASTQSDDILALVRHFGLGRVHLVAHDVGGPVAYAFAAKHRDHCASLTLIEAPLWGIVSDNVPDLVTLFWHLKFHQDVDMAAKMIGADIPAYLNHFYRSFAFNPHAVVPDEAADYIRAYSGIGALRASLMHYHAIPETGEQLKEFSARKLTIPVASYGSAMVMADYSGNAAKLIAEKVDTGIVENCGHWMPDEKPEFVAELIRKTVTKAQQGVS